MVYPGHEENDAENSLSPEQRAALKDKYHINPSQDCSTCHR